MNLNVLNAMNTLLEIKYLKYIVLIGIALVLIYLINTTTVEGWHDWVSNLWDTTTLSGMTPQDAMANYSNRCLTCTPYGYNHLPYIYFKDFEKNMPRKYRSCNNYRCRTQKQNGETAKGYLHPKTRTWWKTPAHSISLEYYNDPQGYCLKNPTHYPCPNHWVKNSELAGSKRFSSYATEDFNWPAMKNRVLPQAQTYCKGKNDNELALCDVNDNKKMLMVYPDMEDHGAC